MAKMGDNRYIIPTSNQDSSHDELLKDQRQCTADFRVHQQQLHSQPHSNGMNAASSNAKILASFLRTANLDSLHCKIKGEKDSKILINAGSKFSGGPKRFLVLEM